MKHHTATLLAPLLHCPLVFRCSSLYFTLIYYIPVYYIVFQCILLDSMAFHCVSLFSTAFSCVSLYSIVFHCSMVFHCVPLCPTAPGGVHRGHGERPCRDPRGGARLPRTGCDRPGGGKGTVSTMPTISTVHDSLASGRAQLGWCM